MAKILVRQNLPLAHDLLIDELCERFEAAARSGVRPGIEDFAQELPPELREDGLAELVVLEIAIRSATGDQPAEEEYERFPALRELVRLALQGPDAKIERPTVWPDMPELVRRLTQDSFLSSESIARCQQSLGPQSASDSAALVQGLVSAGHLTEFQLDYVQRGAVDELLFDDYILVDRLGSGGMGEVFRARHRRMDRDVALKVLSNRSLSVPAAASRFQQEVRAAARLSHPNVVTAYDCRERAGQHYLVLEYVDGFDLAALVNQQGPLPMPAALSCLLQVSRGLQYAHAQGIVHRDIKPSNLIVSRQGVVKVLDLGLARMQTDRPAHNDDPLTESHVFFGTLAYMAPEQAQDTHRADGRADVYSLGCTLHFLLTGRPPFAGETTLQRMLAHRNETPRQLDGQQIPPALEELYQRMLAKDPRQRPELFAVSASLRELWQSECGRQLTDEDLGREVQRVVARPATGGSTAGLHSTMQLARPAAIDTSSCLAPEVTTDRVFKAALVERASRQQGQWYLTAATLLFLVAAGVVVVVQTDRGEVVIESAGDLQVAIKSDQKPVKDWQLQQGKNRTTLRSGKYQIELIGVKSDEWAILNDRVTLSRGGSEVIKITRRVPETLPAVVAPADLFREGAVIRVQNLDCKWYLDHGGLVGDETRGIVINQPERTAGGRWRVERVVPSVIRLQNVASGWYLECRRPVNKEEATSLLKEGQCEVVNVKAPSDLAHWQVVEEGEGVYLLRNVTTRRYLDFRSGRNEGSKRDVLGEVNKTGGGQWLITLDQSQK